MLCLDAGGCWGRLGAAGGVCTGQGKELDCGGADLQLTVGEMQFTRASKASRSPQDTAAAALTGTQEIHLKFICLPIGVQVASLVSQLS
jgi:hypothetical protein